VTGSGAAATKSSGSTSTTAWDLCRTTSATSSCSRPGDFVQIAERSRTKEPFVVAASGAHAEPPEYLAVSLADLVARYGRTPTREEVPVICEEQLVVEYYSR